jgi:uncharacterized membrane protein YjgN (DUF898 family)
MTDPAAAVLDTLPVASTGSPGLPPREAPPQPRRLPLEFTATGGEYFRIWIVNLLLTIVTLGIYSAWAKVRKTRYLLSNTRLDGAAFQYHGRPGAILRGRLLVGAFAVAYSLAGRISITAGIVAASVLGLLAPWLFFKAMRFKLTNTSWRGVRFGFDSTAGASYIALAPGVVMWVLLATQVATLRPVSPGEQPAMAGFFFMYSVFLALVPLLHARLKAYQHRATTWGDVRFDFEPSTGAFYKLYAKTFLVALAPVLVIGVGVAVVVGVYASGRPAPGPSTEAMLPFFVAMYAAMLVAYVFVFAYFSARAQRLVWERTHGGPFAFSTRITAWGLIGIWMKNGILTLLTVGLYWPWAAVDIARYQIACTDIECTGSLDAIAAGAGAVERSAAGDGAIDLVGWDIGL